MFNLLMKPKPWIAISLLVAASAFGIGKSNNCQKPCDKVCPKAAPKECPKPCPQPNPPTQLCPQKQDPCCPAWPVPVLNAGYNYPAGITTRCPVDMTVDASFIYWQPIQENMELGVNVGESVVAATTTSSSVRMFTDFKPGFKVGAGWKSNHDNWDVHGEYTWFHNTQTADFTAVAGTIRPFYADSVAIAATSTSANQNWRLRMDIAELTVGRAHYVGTKLTVHPTFGLRGAWIRQTLTSQFNLGATVNDSFTKKSTSWAVGPQVGLDGNWMISHGFRFYGNAEGDILYTNYSNLSSTHVNSAALTDVVTEPTYGTVRTHLDLELGLGWGMYMNCNKLYLDFTAGYGFQVFFDQNMFRRFSDVAQYTSFAPSGNLYMQGMTLSAKLDF